MKSESRAEEVRKAIELALKGSAAEDAPGAVELVMEALLKRKSLDITLKILLTFCPLLGRCWLFCLTTPR